MQPLRLFTIGIFAMLVPAFLPPCGGAHAQSPRQAAPQAPVPCGGGPGGPGGGPGQPPAVVVAAPSYAGAPGNPIVGPAQGYGGQSYGRWGCDSIWVNGQYYRDGQAIFACYTVQGPDYISIDLQVPGYGWRNIGMYPDDGTGGCFFLGYATGYLQGWRVLQLTDYGGYFGGNPTIVRTYYYVP